MTYKSFREKLKLSRRYDHQCIICGRSFANLACVTVEHIEPWAMKTFKRKARVNWAPSHWQCNMLRGTQSLIVASKLIDRKESKLSSHDFHAWLNAKVPGRITPWYGMISPQDAELVDRFDVMVTDLVSESRHLRG